MNSTDHTSKKTQLVEAARLYYEQNFSQQQIASKLGISRPGVSRILQRARDLGIVRIKIVDPEESNTELEKALKDRYKLKKVILVPNEGIDTSVVKERLGQAASIYLGQILEDDLVLGISWGSTMQEVVKHLTPQRMKGVTVVQLNGGIARADFDTHATEIPQITGKKLHAIPYSLPLPAVVDSAKLKRDILKEKNIAKTLNLAKQAKVALFTIGAFSFDSVLVKADYFDRKEVEYLLSNQAVGDICSRIISEDGSICWDKLNARTVGIDLVDLKKKEYAIAVAGGSEKLRAIRAGLAGGYFNVLITDEWVAIELLRMQTT